jgi:hypothetical protein
VPLKVIRSVKFLPVICGATVTLPLTGIAAGGLFVVLLGGAEGEVMAELVGTVGCRLVVVLVAVSVGLVAGAVLVAFVVGGALGGGVLLGVEVGGPVTTV